MQDFSSGQAGVVTSLAAHTGIHYVAKKWSLAPKDPSQTQKSQPCVPAGGVHSGKAKAWAGDCHRFWKVHVSQTSPEQPILNRQPSPPSFLCGQFPEHLLHPRLQEGRQKSTVRALSPRAHGESVSHIRGVGMGRRGAGSQITALKRL